jgi:predicted TPR repeat methyltransferase
LFFHGNFVEDCRKFHGYSLYFLRPGTGLVGEELKQLGFSNIDGSDMSMEILRKAEAKV